MSPAFLLHLCDATDRTARCISGFLWTHPRRQVFFHLLLQMKTQLVVQFLFDSRTTQVRSQTQLKLVHPAHHSYLKATMGSTREARRAGR